MADLQQKYGKRVVVKIKSRDRHFALGNPYEKDISFVKTVLKNTNELIPPEFHTSFPFISIAAE